MSIFPSKRVLAWLLGSILMLSPLALGDESETVTAGDSSETSSDYSKMISTLSSSAQPPNWLRSLTGEPITSLSDAELIAMIARSSEADENYMKSLNEELEGEDTPFTRASEFFEKYDQEMDSLRSALSEAQQFDHSELRESLEFKIAQLEPVHSLAKERFDLAIERRRLIVQMLPVIEMRVALSQIMMGVALGEINSFRAAEVKDESSTATTQEAEQLEPGVDEAADLLSLYYPPGMAPKAEEKSQAVDAPTSKRRLSEEFILAAAEVKQWEQALTEVNESISLIEARLEVGDRVLELERSVAKNARQTLDNSEALRAVFSDQFQQQTMDGLPVAEQESVRQLVQEFSHLSKIARERSRMASDRVENIMAARTHLLEALATRKMDAQLAQTNLEHASLQMTRIQNPFHPRNLFRWFLDHGPAILAILAGMTVMYFVVQVIGSRIVRLLTSRGSRGSKAERLSRANTLVYTFRQAGKLAVLMGGALMILEEVGIPIVPLLGGAAVFGLAIAFGAQNLIKDFFQGFMILLENQYKLNDVVQIGDHAGLVEQINLRTTALRSLDGTLHFIPNGQIEAVSNLTHGWSRAVFDIPVAYREDVDQVMDVINKVCREVREDPSFRFLCLEDATMLGVDDFADSAVIIKFFIKTIPLQQWTVRREVLRRIKIQFDKEKIEIPFPHHTHYMRAADGSPLEEVLIGAVNGQRN